MSLMSAEEKLVLGHLVNAWQAFLDLPTRYDGEQKDFCEAIHRCQSLLFMRPVLLELQQEQQPQAPETPL